MHLVCDTPQTVRVRSLDLQLLLDLLVVEENPERFDEVVQLVLAQVEDLLLVGDLEGTRRLVEALATAGGTRNPGRQPAAKQAIQRLVDGSLMMARHAPQSMRRGGRGARGGPACGRAVAHSRLAETLAPRARARQRLTELLKRMASTGVSRSTSSNALSPAASARRRSCWDLLAPRRSRTSRNCWPTRIERAARGGARAHRPRLTDAHTAAPDDGGGSARGGRLEWNSTRDEKATLCSAIVREASKGR
jgi:hypothetical protein